MANDFIKLSLKGQEYTFTALSFSQLDELDGDFTTLNSMASGEMPNPAQRASIVAICAASLSSKHPDLQTADVARLLTMANISDALKAVAGQQVAEAQS
jgi:hypothetical protein